MARLQKGFFREVTKYEPIHNVTCDTLRLKGRYLPKKTPPRFRPTQSVHLLPKIGVSLPKGPANSPPFLGFPDVVQQGGSAIPSFKRTRTLLAMKFPFKKIGLLSTERCWWMRRFHPPEKRMVMGMGTPALKHTELTCALGLARNATRNVIPDFSPRMFSVILHHSHHVTFSLQSFHLNPVVYTPWADLIGWMKTSEKTGGPDHWRKG